MAEKKPTATLIVPAVLMLTIAIAARLSIPLLIEVMLVLPVAAALLQYYSGWIGVAGVCVAAGLTCGYVLPSGAIPAIILWCGGSLAAAVVPVRRPVFRPVIWAAVCVSTWIALLLIVSRGMEGPIAIGLAEKLCQIVEESPERNSILINAYSMGLARLEGTEALVPAVRVMGNVVIAEETRMQMLYSLRVSLEEVLPSLLCSTVVYHTGLTTLLCTMLPDWRRRKRGEEGLLPSMDRWYMPRRMGRAVCALLIGWLFSLFSGEGAGGYVGNLCMGVFRFAFMLQGICFLLWMGKRMGVKSVMRSVWAVLLSVIAPIIPIVMGMIDQRKDARHLRPKEEAGQE